MQTAKALYIEPIERSGLARDEDDAPDRCRFAYRARPDHRIGAGAGASRLRGPDDRDGARTLQGGGGVLWQGRVRAGPRVVLAGLCSEEAPRGPAQSGVELLEERPPARRRSLFQA